ncbi:hypothetical protein NZ45_14085 [Clostridium botulinum]|uniref:Transposase n=1 Tax=Clostridium botulinum TaxID=1491 RepID=A0ABD7CLH5_CLOBO|nr:DUF6262 family protein [Clostridium botulinum]KGO13100.1 hypothetical protein NZ45_14085 [Clostridium botulinum]QRI53953.1 transposase [Clostridium botulinum]
MKHKRNVEGLKKYQEKKNQETIKKVIEVIEKLKYSKTKAINFKTVAEESGVSKATLYNNPVLKERILSLRAISKGALDESVIELPKDKLKQKDKKIKQLYEEIKKLKQQQQDLIVQLVQMEELKEENRRLKEQIGIK